MVSCALGAFMSDRDAFREAREAGLRARHEQRLARAKERDIPPEPANLSDVAFVDEAFWHPTDDGRWIAWDRQDIEVDEWADLVAIARKQDQRDPVVFMLAAEVKVLTETATKVAYELGRKDAGEEIAEGIEAVRDSVGRFPIENLDDLLTSHQAWTNAAQIARDLTSEPSGAVSDERSGVGGHQEVSEAPKSPQEPCGCLLGPLHTEADHQDLTKEGT
jgi:hypothetical protein